MIWGLRPWGSTPLAWNPNQYQNKSVLNLFNRPKASNREANPPPTESPMPSNLNTNRNSLCLRKQVPWAHLLLLWQAIQQNKHRLRSNRELSSILHRWRLRDILLSKLKRLNRRRLGNYNRNDYWVSRLGSNLLKGRGLWLTSHLIGSSRWAEGTLMMEAGRMPILDKDQKSNWAIRQKILAETQLNSHILAAENPYPTLESNQK